MAIDRLETFRSFIAKSPNDPFPRYGMAMELRSRGDLEAASAAFGELVTGFPDYVPTYLMAGGVLAQLGRREEAAGCYRLGVEVAARKGDLHAKKELEAALAEHEADGTD